MSSADPSTPSSSKKRKSTVVSETTSSEPPYKVRETLKIHKIFICLVEYEDHAELHEFLKATVLVARGSSGIPVEKIQTIKAKANAMVSVGEGTASDTLVSDLFTVTGDRNDTKCLMRVALHPFESHCIPKPDPGENMLFAAALLESKSIAYPKPDYTFGVNPDERLGAFTEREETTNILQRVKMASKIMKDLRYPFFVVEWKSSVWDGNHFKAQNQAARAGAAIVSSMVKLYRNTATLRPVPKVSSAITHPKLRNEAQDELNRDFQTWLMEKTACFSATVDSYSVHLYVHWWSYDDAGRDTWNMSNLAAITFAEKDMLAFRNFRRIIDNIMDWGMLKRLNDIKKELEFIALKVEAEMKDKGKGKAVAGPSGASGA
ncbi:hypothetical protein MMC16_001760 [Acarospora aff. strigata]|nr:hypothetical protein [Acarospora aff. strigata]